MFWALFLEFTLEIENLQKNPHFFVATIEECALKKFHWWHYLHNWLPEIGFSASKSKLLFMERLPKPIAQPIGVQPMIQKIVLTRVFKITNYGSCHMTMPMIPIILPIQVLIINPLPRKCKKKQYIPVIGAFFVHCLRLKE
jgi:hypothetical protein